MKRFNADEVRQIAEETGDNKIIARFESYISQGYVTKAVKKITNIFKPFGAATGKLDKIKNFPLLASPKYDGIRGILHPEYGLLTKQSKSIPNHYIREKLEGLGVSYLDGEIVTYTNGKIDGFNITQKKVMAEEGNPDFKYFVFDDFEYPLLDYIQRLCVAIGKIRSPLLELVTWEWADNAEQLAKLEERYSRMSEGMIVRNPKAPYKFGKSTLREGGLIKIKRFSDDEGIIVAINQLTDDSPGVGAFVVKWKGIIFNLGNGWSDMDAKEMWRLRHELMGHKITFKYQGVGTNGAPRFASFLGIRYDA